VLRLYWIAVAVVVAVAVHVGFVLFAPAYRFSLYANELTAGQGANQFLIVAPDQQARLFPNLPRQSVVGVCLYDVSKGDVSFMADLPDGFWVTTIYTDRGKPIYSVNNRQSGANAFTVSLSLAPGFIDMLINATDKERPEIDSGWTVMSTEPRGLVVVWYPLVDAAMRSGVAYAMERSRCLTGAQRTS
jgi:uncharacterized membrane protein